MFILSSLLPDSKTTSNLGLHDVLLPIRNWIDRIEIKILNKRKACAS